MNPIRPFTHPSLRAAGIQGRATRLADDLADVWRWSSSISDLDAGYIADAVEALRAQARAAALVPRAVAELETVAERARATNAYGAGRLWTITEALQFLEDLRQ